MRAGGQPAGRREIAQRVGVDPQTITNVATVYAQRGGDVVATIQRKKRLTPPVEPKVTGEVEARSIALACSTPPPGHARWSLRLLERQVQLAQDIPDMDHPTIGKVLKKALRPHLKKCWTIPSAANGESREWKTFARSMPARRAARRIAR
jgi:transposase